MRSLSQRRLGSVGSSLAGKVLGSLEFVDFWCDLDRLTILLVLLISAEALFFRTRAHILASLLKISVIWSFIVANSVSNVAHAALNAWVSTFPQRLEDFLLNIHSIELFRSGVINYFSGFTILCNYSARLFSARRFPRC